MNKPEIQKLALPKYGLPPWLFEFAAGGVQISGDSGTGKSTLMASLMALVAGAGLGFMLVDPHGDLAQKMRDFLVGQGASTANRVYYIAAGDAFRITPLNPLAVPNNLDPVTWRSRITVKVAHMARILLHAWGERDFNSKPLMFKWVTRFLRSLALLGLPLNAVRHFFDVHSPFRALVSAVPDFVAREEMLELAELRPSEREEFIASTKNRFLGLLENPLVEMIFSCVERCIDIAWHIRNQSILLIDLAPMNNLRPEDQSILANTWLNELLHAVYNTPAAERSNYFCFIDELPVFASCAPQIIDASRQIRKMQLRIIAAHQGTTFFPDGQDDMLLNAMVGQFRTHFYFGHTNPVDARYFGEIIGLPTYDPKREKFRLTQDQQIQDGFDLVILEDRSEQQSTTQTQGGSETSGTNTQTSQSEQSGQSQSATQGATWDEYDPLRRVLSDARQKAQSAQQGSSTSAGQNHATAANWATANAVSSGRTFKQTLVPRLTWREVLTSVTFYTPEEHFLEAARMISELDVGEAFFHAAGKGIALVKTPLLPDPFQGTPKFAARKQREFLEVMHLRPEFILPAEIDEQNRKALVAYVEALNQLPAGQSAKGLPARQKHQVEQVEDDPDSPLAI